MGGIASEIGFSTRWARQGGGTSSIRGDHHAPRFVHNLAPTREPRLETTPRLGQTTAPNARHRRRLKTAPAEGAHRMQRTPHPPSSARPPRRVAVNIANWMASSDSALKTTALPFATSALDATSGPPLAGRPLRGPSVPSSRSVSEARERQLDPCASQTRGASREPRSSADNAGNWPNAGQRLADEEWSPCNAQTQPG